MASVDENFVTGPLKIMKANQMKTNYVQVYNKVLSKNFTCFQNNLKSELISFCRCFFQLKLMATVHQTQPTIQLLLQTNDYVGALDLISTSQEVLSQELQGLVCFR